MPYTFDLNTREVEAEESQESRVTNPTGGQPGLLGHCLKKEEEEGEKEIALQKFWILVLRKNHIIVGSQKMEKSQNKHVNIASGPKFRA